MAYTCRTPTVDHRWRTPAVHHRLCTGRTPFGVLLILLGFVAWSPVGVVGPVPARPRASPALLPANNPSATRSDASPRTVPWAGCVPAVPPWDIVAGHLRTTIRGKPEPAPTAWTPRTPVHYRQLLPVVHCGYSVHSVQFGGLWSKLAVIPHNY